MQNKEPERDDPSGYAFGVKCSVTLSGERHSSARKDPPRRCFNVSNWYKPFLRLRTGRAPANPVATAARSHGGIPYRIAPGGAMERALFTRKQGAERKLAPGFARLTST